MAVVAAEARKAGRPLPPWQLFESIRERARERERERERESESESESERIYKGRDKEPNTTQTEFNRELFFSRP